jgi:glycosyltransferase involved in cell wall biosynthesis
MQRGTRGANEPQLAMPAYEAQMIETLSPPDAKRRDLSRRPLRKILFVTNTNEYGGAEKHLLELIRRLREAPVQVCILCFDIDFFTERLGPDDHVEIITCKKAPGSLRDWAGLFRRIHPDVAVFVYGWFWALPWMAVVGAWRAGVRRRFSIQHLITAPWPVSESVSMEWKRRKSIRRRLARLLGREPRGKPQWMTELPLAIVACLGTSAELKLSAYLCKRTICVSRKLRDCLVEDFGFPAWKLKTVYNGISVSEFVPSESRRYEVRARLGLGRDEFTLVCVARLNQQKGIDILIQAMARVLRDGVPCKSLIVGDGPLRDELMEQVREMGLSGHVFFEGFHEDVRPYLQASSAFILTSHMEGLPLSLLEAMACGLPSIVTDVGGNAEVITHGVHGLIVRPGSIDAVAEAITYLATHPQERAQMARMARTRVCDAFDIENAMAEIRRVILN